MPPTTATAIDRRSNGYQVALPVFEGPLDLLLHLIEREELDITQVSLAQITNQFLDYLAQISERDPDSLADFLVVAAKLLLIKSRVLLPQPPAPPESEEDDIGEDLVRQLIEYKRFREIASWFRELDQKGFQSYVRLAGTPSIEPITDLGDVSLDDLLAAVREVLALKPAEPSVDTAVAPIRIRMADQIQLIERETAGGKRVSFRHLLEGARSRLEVIVTLLALLELVKQLRVTMRQGGLFGDIEIQARESSGPEVEQGPSSGPEALADTTSPVD